MSEEPEVPLTGAVFTFGKSKFAENAPSKFWIKRDTIVAISCGDEHTAVVTQTGRLFTFGSNEFGQLGLGHNESILKPSCVKSLKPDKVKAVACGKSHTVVSMASGLLWAFGSNAEGQLGIGQREPESTNRPLKIQSSLIEDDLIVALDAGSVHNVALGQSGSIYVWGSNKEGQLGLGAEGEESLFTPTKLILASGSLIRLISCGYYHSALVTDDGDLYTFGEPDGGKLGLGNSNTTANNNTETEADVPNKVELTSEEGQVIKVAKVSCGGDHTLVLTTSGEVIAFGTSSNGQLGLGTRILETPQPLKIASLAPHKVVEISCGENHSALVTEDGKLLTFGDGRHGKLCLDVDTLTNHYTPVPSSRFRGFHVENAVCGGCHTMVHARPDPSYNESPNDPIYANGHEEINLEARRRHRQEKQPPFLEDDSEKILTIEQAEVVDQQGGEQEQINPQDNQTEVVGEDNNNQAEDQPQQPQTKGQKISSFFKNLGRKKGGDENNKTPEKKSSPEKKRVRFFGRNKQSEVKEEAADAEGESENDKKDQDESNGKEETTSEAKDEEKSDDDKSEAESQDEKTRIDSNSEAEESEDEDEDVSSLEDNSNTSPSSQKESKKGDKEAKKGKRVTISSQEDIREASKTNSPSTTNDQSGRKKSRACTIL